MDDRPLFDELFNIRSPPLRNVIPPLLLTVKVPTIDELPPTKTSELKVDKPAGKLKELNIKNVITAISGMTEIYPDEFNYMLVDVLDIKQQDMTPMFDDTTKFIKDSLDKGEKVYIHCMCGASRSVSIVCAFLTKEHGIEPEEAIKMIRNIRKVANPNPSFRNQLQNYHETVNAKTL